jgi:hypothetical protein
MALLFDIHLAATCFMTGVIWFVQLVHYPLFPEFEGSRFGKAMQQHQSRTSLVVVPAMVLELSTGVWLALAQWPLSSLPALALGLLLLIWLITFSISAPIHGRLEKGFDPHLIARLVATNWARTLLWSCRCMILVLYASDVL